MIGVDWREAGGNCKVWLLLLRLGLFLLAAIILVVGEEGLRDMEDDGEQRQEKKWGRILVQTAYLSKFSPTLFIHEVFFNPHDPRCAITVKLYATVSERLSLISVTNPQQFWTDLYTESTFQWRIYGCYFWPTKCSFQMNSWHHAHKYEL